MPKRTFTAFVSVSFKEEDREIANWFCNVIRSMNIEPVLADVPEPRPPQEKVQDLINSSDAFIGIFLKRDKVEGKDLWKPPAWCHDELGMAYGSKPILIFVERGVQIEGLMSSVADYEIFERGKELYKYVPKIVQYFMSLRDLLRGLPEDFGIFQTYYAVMDDLTKALHHFIYPNGEFTQFFSFTGIYLRTTGRLYGISKELLAKIEKAYDSIYMLNDAIYKRRQKETGDIIFETIETIVDCILSLSEKIPHPDYKLSEERIKELLEIKDLRKVFELIVGEMRKMTPKQIE